PEVGRGGGKDFTKATREVGVVVFREENNGNLVYMTQTGEVAVVPAKMYEQSTKTGPNWQHGMELAVRKEGEKEFTKDTKRYGIEVFKDEPTGNLIYIGETGTIAVVPAKLAKYTPDGKAKAPERKHAMELSARKAGEAEFTAKTKKYGIEVYTDENNGNLIYITETGDFSVVPKE